MDNLKVRIQSDTKDALKAGDSAKRMVLNMLLTSITNKEIEKRTQLSKKGVAENLEKESELTDEEIQSVLSTEAKKRKESIEAFTNGGRQEMAENEKKELAVISSYLPEQIGEDELRKIVQETTAELNATSVQDTGNVMKAVMAKVKGRADGSLVSRFVKEILEK